jgi:hypothetical protein
MRIQQPAIIRRQREVNRHRESYMSNRAVDDSFVDLEIHFLQRQESGYQCSSGCELRERWDAGRR